VPARLYGGNVTQRIQCSLAQGAHSLAEQAGLLKWDQRAVDVMYQLHQLVHWCRVCDRGTITSTARWIPLEQSCLLSEENERLPRGALYRAESHYHRTSVPAHQAILAGLIVSSKLLKTHVVLQSPKRETELAWFMTPLDQGILDGLHHLPTRFRTALSSTHPA